MEKWKLVGKQHEGAIKFAENENFCMGLQKKINKNLN
jgi:hypothetical protein